MHVALFDSLELFSGDAPRLYSLYSALPVEPDLQYQLTRALYFDRKRNDYSLEYVRAETVHALGLLDSEEAFEVELRRLETKLGRPRLGERTLLPPAGHAGAGAFMVKALEFLTADSATSMWVTTLQEIATHRESEQVQ